MRFFPLLVIGLLSIPWITLFHRFEVKDIFLALETFRIIMSFVFVILLLAILPSNRIYNKRY
jgi:hypothetical protein